jgi:hypothetical protein
LAVNGVATKPHLFFFVRWTPSTTHGPRNIIPHIGQLVKKKIAENAEKIVQSWNAESVQNVNKKSIDKC